MVNFCMFSRMAISSQPSYFKCFSHDVSSKDFSVKVSILHMHKKVFFHFSTSDINFIIFSSGVRKEFMDIFIFLLCWCNFGYTFLRILFSFRLIFDSNLVPHITLFRIFFTFKRKLRKLIAFGMVIFISGNK
jgi:hypothetical protein